MRFNFYTLEILLQTLEPFCFGTCVIKGPQRNKVGQQGSGPVEQATQGWIEGEIPKHHRGNGNKTHAACKHQKQAQLWKPYYSLESNNNTTGGFL